MNNSLPVAYSRLPAILARHRLNISGLREKLQAAGVSVNQKSLYRLATSKPLQKIDTRILGAICQTCGVGIQDLISFERPAAVLEKLSEADQTRLEQLMDGHNEGKLNSAELRELEELAEKAHELTMENARRLLAQRQAVNFARVRKNGSHSKPTRDAARPRRFRRTR